MIAAAQSLDSEWRDFLGAVASRLPLVARALSALERPAPHDAAEDRPGGPPSDEREAHWFDARFFAARSDVAEVARLAAAELALPRTRDPVRQLGLEVLIAIGQARRPGVVSAFATLEECEVRARELGASHLLLRTLSELGRSVGIQGDSLRAIELFQAAVQLARERGDVQAEAQNLANLGFVFGERAEPVPYARYSREALALHASFEDPSGEAGARCNLAGALLQLGEIDEAMEHYGLARAAAEARGYRYVEALCLAGEGAGWCMRADVDRGASLFERSNAILRALGHPFQVSRHLHLLAGHFASAGRWSEARDLCVQAIASAQEGGFDSIRAQSLLSLSQACEAQGDHTEALHALRAYVAAQQRMTDGLLEGRVRAAEERHRAEAARKEADHERSRNEALRAVNQELRESLERQRELQEELVRASHTDPLTRLSNRRHMRSLLDHEVRRIARRFRPLSLVLIDVDHFKAINDLHGHEVGDEVLVELGTRLHASVRAVDPVARWGGEEFCIAFFETDGLAAGVPAEKVRARVAGMPFSTRAGEISVTVSIGIASVADGAVDVDEVLRRADLALYEAKRRGRNCVVSAP